MKADSYFKPKVAERIKNKSKLNVLPESDVALIEAKYQEILKWCEVQLNEEYDKLKLNVSPKRHK